MYNIREFNHKFIEASHLKIEIQLLKIWNLEVKFWVPILKAIVYMKMGSNFDPR